MLNFPRLISEVSSNHLGDLNRCKEFIKISKDVGCWAVKFQLFKIDNLFAPEILSKSEKHRARVAWELPTTFLPELANFTHDLGMKFSCTPFDLQAVADLQPFVDFYKIASYEMIWDDLIIECAKTKKDLVMSTGMATLEEIEHAQAVFKRHSDAKLTLLHAVSGYPTPYKEANLAAIKTLKDKFSCDVGLSDHSRSQAVVLRAIQKWNASVVELHLDIDSKGAEFSSGHCWLPAEIKQLVSILKQGLEADGTGEKKPMRSEMHDRQWRADPSDGLRPLKHIRKNFNG